MTLTLRAISLNGLPLTQPITAHFGAAGGTIGRADLNTLALPDPERHISRQHARISAAAGGFCISNIGSANPVVVRGQALAQGESAMLQHLDQVRLGGYLLEVIDETADDAPTITRARTPVRGGAVPPDSVGDLARPLSAANPFADLLGAEAVPVAPPPVPPMPQLLPGAGGVAPGSAAWGAAEAQRAPQRGPAAGFDPFAAAPTAQAPPPTPEAFGGGGVFGDLVPGSAPASIDQLFGLGTVGGDPLAGFMADAAAPALARDAPAAPQPTAGTSPDHAPALRSAYAPPAMVARPILPLDTNWFHAPAPASAPPEATSVTPAFVRPVRAEPPPLREEAAELRLETPEPAVSPPAAAPPSAAAIARIDTAASARAPQTAADATVLWQAFCEGAGIRLDPPQGLNPELMQMIGRLLRAATEGTLRLVSVRASTKHELHAEVTVIRARDNNPLKFSPDAQSALEQLLQPPLRGFLAGPAAMDDAMHDLLGHAIGSMAGTRAALEGVLDRFTPQALEAKLVGRSMLDSLLPMNRKARLWELYLQHFDSVRNEAQEDFHALFGRAFLAAYEQQIDRLQHGGERSPPSA